MTNTQEVKEYKLTFVDVKDLKLDPSNPNQMTLEQIRGLEKSLLKFGNLVPIIVNQNNEVIDGQHRIEVYRAFNITKIPCFVKYTDSDIDRIELRQVMNKLRGTHNKNKDSNELLRLMQNDKIDELSELIAEPKDDLYDLIKKFNPDINVMDDEYNDEEKDQLDKKLISFVSANENWELGNSRLIVGDTKSDEHNCSMLLTKYYEYTRVEPIRLADGAKFSEVKNKLVD